MTVMMIHFFSWQGDIDGLVAMLLVLPHEGFDEATLFLRDEIL